MRKGPAILILAMLVLVPFSGVFAATPSDIVADGDLSEWESGSLMGTFDSEVAFYTTWNETHLSFAWEGTDWAEEILGADWFIYLNTSDGGSPLSKDWDGQHVLPFNADHAFVLEDNGYYSVLEWDGAGWVDSAVQADSTHIGWSGNLITEVAIPWTALGDVSSIDFLSWTQEQDSQDVWASFPDGNPSSSGQETFTHAWHLAERNSSVEPNSLPIWQASAPTKVDDALNLAIVFHQHQPYYKNKLTGMYEMPWVRVHAMTEYVDSPGILAASDTKVTYNLVPSLIEQMIEYTDNSTLDVHTDIARRAWNEGGYPNATDLELHTMQFQSFWNSGWIYNVSSDDTRVGWLYPSATRYSEIYGMTRHNLKPATIMDDTLLAPQEFLDLQVLWYLYQFSPDYVQGTYNFSHRDNGLISLFQQSGNYSVDDLHYVLDAQSAHMANVLPMYAELATSGQVELTTTPYYHPIMPLLMMDGWTMEDGIRVNKQAWPEDVQTHLTNGMDLFESELGFRPTGMWPSEEAVSPAMVQPVSDVGVEWMVTDYEILSQSTDLSGSNIDAGLASNLAIPWRVSGEDGGEVAVIFRDRVISDRIAFQYGSMTPEAAVDDFIAYLDDVRQQLLDEGKDPSEHLLTVALDGENWMFMSEFQHNDNGRPYMEEWYSRLSTHPTVVTTTPGEFLSQNHTLPQIQSIGTGSWIDGTLSTWAGEAEESLAWQRLVEARQALVDFESENPEDAGLEAAWESLYIAEGSDWYWWYGLDQDSGYDELWDVLYKVHLSNIYRAINLELPPYLQELWTSPALPEVPYSGIIEPLIDGQVLPGEWDGAAKYDAPIDGGWLDIENFHLGYDASNVFVRIDMTDIDTLLCDDTADCGDDPDIQVYFMAPNAVNFNEVQTNFRTYHGEEVIGFPAKKMVTFNFDDLREDGRSSWSIFDARGKAGDSELWVLETSSTLGGAAMDDVFEFQIPWSDLGLAPRYSTRVKVVSAHPQMPPSGQATGPSDWEMAPPAPAELILPDLETWVELMDIADQVGDEDGTGGITYGTASDFAPGEGLFDLTNLQMWQSSWNVRFEFTIDEITDIWGMPNGFSHQIVQIYVDKDRVTGSGNTALLEGANAEAHPDWAWEVALSATGEPGAVKAVMASSGETTAKGVSVSADSTTGKITMTVSKGLIGDSPQSYGYIFVIGSQDGFGPGKWRDVDETAKTWRMGGGADPADDGIDYDPNILDMIVAEGVDQAAMLSAYDVAGHTYAQLTGIEVPQVPQQIFGLNVGEVTGTTAVLTWSTTQSANSSIYYHISSQQGQCCHAETANSTSHGITLVELLTNTTYFVNISVSSDISVTTQFTTSNEVDDTPPQLLNLIAEQLESGQVRLTWFTSEATTEFITWEGGHFQGDTVALRKSHQIDLILKDGTYTLKVIAVDAAGNEANASTTITVVDGAGGSAGEGGGSTGNGQDCQITDDCESEGERDGLSQLLRTSEAQITLLIIAVFVGFAFLRAGRTPPEFQD